MSLLMPENVADVTLSDTTVFNPAGKLFIGGAGNLKIDGAQSGTATFNNLEAGKFLNVRAKKAYSTGSTATNIVRCW